MNVNQNISKLLIALKQKGKIYRINSFKFYSKIKYKYITKYQILKRELIPEFNGEKEKIEFKEITANRNKPIMKNILRGGI